MSRENLPDFVFVGAPKCATTWIYECLREHPGVYLPDTDKVNFFNCQYDRGLDHYLSYFKDAEGSQVIGEMSNEYIKSQEAPSRISNDLSDPKIIFTLRNPVERAFSNWWHSYSRGNEIEFTQFRESYSAYLNWIHTGFYYRHLERFLGHFDEDQIKLVFMDDLKEDDEKFIQDIFQFIGVDSTFEPSKLEKKVNQSKNQEHGKYTELKKFARSSLPGPAKRKLKPIKKFSDSLLSDKTAYEEGMSEDTRRELESIFRSDISNLADFTGRDLSHWLEYENLDTK